MACYQHAGELWKSAAEKSLASPTASRLEKYYIPSKGYICIHITRIFLKIIIQWLTVKQLSPTMDLAKIPVLPPPLGVMPNFVNPENRASILIIISTIFLALLLPFVVLRLYTRIWITRTFGLDDGKHALLT
jgi:hypothetical protein